MSKLTKQRCGIIIIALNLLFILAGCKTSGDSVPFPDDKSEKWQPASRPFKFSDPVPINWIVVNPDSVKPMTETKFQLDKLPSKPFDIGEPQPILKPLSEKPFDIEAIPDTVIDFDKLPGHPLKFITRVLGRPQVIKATLPAGKTGLSRGILEFGTNIGLPGVARCFVQDKYGIMWIGTYRGICRYDGENIEVYGLEQGLPNVEIFSLFLDDKEQIWAGTGSGTLFILNRATGLIKQLADTFAGQTIYAINKDASGKIWFGKEGRGSGALIIDEEKQTIKNLTPANGLPNGPVFGILNEPSGRSLLLFAGGLAIVDPASGKIKKITKANGLGSGFSPALLRDNKDRIWIGGDGGVDIIDLKSKNIKHLWKDQGLELTRFVCGLMQDREGKMWIGTDTGIVYKFDEERQLLQKNIVNIGRFNDVYNICEDATGQVWMGSIRGSSYVYNAANGKPASYTTNEGLGSNNVWNVVKHSNGSFWIGTYNGIDIYDPHTRSVKHLGKEQGLINPRNTNLTEDNQKRILAAGNPEGISIIDIENGTIKQFGHAQGLNTNNDCSTIISDQQGQIWIGSSDKEILVINPEQKLVKKVIITPELNELSFFALQKDSKGKIWAGGFGYGVVVINPANNTIKRLGTAEGLISNNPTVFAEDNEGRMWIGTDKGVEIADLQNNTLTSITKSDGLPAADIYTINIKDNCVYLGTSLGLTILTRSTSTTEGQAKWKVQNIGKTEGLIHADIAQNSSLVTEEGAWWAGGDNQALVVVDKPNSDSLTTIPYVTGVNIMDKPFEYSNKHYSDAELKNVDTIWKTDQSSFYPNKQLPADTGYLTKNNITWDSIGGPYNLPANLQLPYNRNYLSFTFNGTQISNPDKAMYRYILEGIDKNWSATTNKNVSENYRDLPYGGYTFKVSSKGTNGVWSSPAEFRFTITPPWWRTWWAYAGYLLLFLGGLRIFSKWRERSLRAEKDKLEVQVNTRTRQLQETIENLKATQAQLVQSEKMASLGELTAGIAHEIQNPLNFVNNFSEVNKELLAEMNDEIEKGNLTEVKAISKNINDNEEKIIFHGKRADAIVKSMLQHSRSSNNKREPTDINALCDEYLRLAYHGLRAKDKSFNAQFETRFDQNLGKVSVVPQEMGRVVLNLINNAFYAVNEKARNGHPGYQPTVTLSTSEVPAGPGQKKSIRISIADNGDGIPQTVLDKVFQPFFTTKPAGQGTGLGLSLSYDIVKAHGGEIALNTTSGEGTEFIIQLPFL